MAARLPPLQPDRAADLQVVEQLASRKRYRFVIADSSRVVQ